jgi:hypothetical protein
MPGEPSRRDREREFGQPWQLLPSARIPRRTPTPAEVEFTSLGKLLTARQNLLPG